METDLSSRICSSRLAAVLMPAKPPPRITIRLVFRGSEGRQHSDHSASPNERQIASRHQAFRHYLLIETPAHAIAEAFRVVAYHFEVVKVLRLGGPEAFPADRTMNGDYRPVAPRTPRPGVF